MSKFRQIFRIFWKLFLVYYSRIKGDTAENIERKIEFYETALEILVFNPAVFRQRAAIQNNLAIAYYDRIREDKAENIEKAIGCYELALEVRTRADFPQDWAAIQNNLAIAYSNRIREDRGENIEKAIACYELALEVRTRAASPQDWAMTQNNLAAAYSDRIREDKAENIEKAIACYELALEVRTRAAFPQDWAMTQNNLAIAYSDRIREDKAENIEKAIACYDLALLVSTRAAFPQDWAETQENLAYVYQEKGLIPEAIKHFKSSLEIFKPDALPLSCLKVARNLGDLGFAESLWETAIFGYEKAIEAVEQSREWMASENRKREIIEENLDVYEKMMQSCINYQQYDKALQTIERSKSRYLVELFTNSEIYPKTATATEKQQLQNLRRQIASLQQFLETQTPISPLPTPVSPLPPPLTKGGPGGVPDSPSQRTTQTRPHIPELSQQQEKLVTALQQLEQFLETFKQREPEFKLTQKIQPIDIAEFQKTLDPKTAIIEWYIGNSPEGGHAPSTAPTDVGGPRYLLDGFPDGVKYSPSLQLLELVKNRITTRKSPPPNQQQLFALQNPTEDLFNADMEVETIKTRFDLHQILLKKQATKIALNANGENIANANYLHFSCHGVFDFDYPLQSSLVLADSLEPILEINPPQPPLAKGGLREENTLAKGGLREENTLAKGGLREENTLAKGGLREE
ncbi:MAG: CHAT domain-containing protein, partial [Microcoleus sp.]